VTKKIDRATIYEYAPILFITLNPVKTIGVPLSFMLTCSSELLSVHCKRYSLHPSKHCKVCGTNLPGGAGGGGGGGLGRHRKHHTLNF
jgi:hypothetical protein